jgi:hypothetical protein
MDRRTAIMYALGGVASVAAIPLFNFVAGKTSYASDVVEATGEPVILSLIANEREILEIGRTIRMESKDNLDVEQLIGLVLAGIPRQCYQPALNEPELKLHISRKIQEEFKNEEIKVVKGWVLSRTEALQCHLYHSLLAQQ